MTHEHALVTGRLSAMRNLQTGSRVIGVGYHRLTAPRTVTSCVFFEVRDGSRRPKEGYLPGHPRARVHAKERTTRDVATGRVTGGNSPRSSIKTLTHA